MKAGGTQVDNESNKGEEVEKDSHDSGVGDGATITSMVGHLATGWWRF